MISRGKAGSGNNPSRSSSDLSSEERGSTAAAAATNLRGLEEESKIAYNGAGSRLLGNTERKTYTHITSAVCDYYSLN